MNLISLCFAAGAFGGLANSLVVWIFGAQGITQSLGVRLAPDLTPEWLYPRIVWGGLWGLLFLLPLPRRGHFFRGAIFSLAPSLVMLLYILPVRLGQGILGLDLGILTPLLVLFYNLVWGLAAALWLHVADVPLPDGAGRAGSRLE